VAAAPGDGRLYTEEQVKEMVKEQMTKDQERNSVTAAFILLGMMLSMLTMFYLVNCRSKLIRMMTWKVVSAICSIFCAILLFNVLHVAWYEHFGASLAAHGATLLIVFLLVQTLLYAWSWHPRRAAAVGTVGGHVAGFAGQHFFGQLQLAYFGGGLTMSLLGVAASALVIAAMLGASALARRYLAPFMNMIDKRRTRLLAHAPLSDRSLRGSQEEGEAGTDQWFENCEDFEDDYAGMVLGFVISQSVRVAGDSSMLSVDYSESVEWEVQNNVHDETAFREALRTTVAGVCFMVACGLATWARNRLQRGGHLGPDRVRAVSFFQNLLGMTGAWLLASGTRIVDRHVILKHLRTEVGMEMINAALVSAVSVVTIFGLDLTASLLNHDLRSLHAVVASLGLWIGIAWEKVFDYAIDDVSEHSRLLKGNEYADVYLSLLVYAVTMPAWELYILPKTNHRLAAWSGWQDTSQDKWSSSGKSCESDGSEEE